MKYCTIFAGSLVSVSPRTPLAGRLLLERSQLNPQHTAAKAEWQTEGREGGREDREVEIRRPREQNDKSQWVELAHDTPRATMKNYPNSACFEKFFF